MKQSVAGIFCLCILGMVIVGPRPFHPTDAYQTNNPIANENNQPGTTSWQSVALMEEIRNGDGANEPAHDWLQSSPLLSEPPGVAFTQPVINGYAGQTSINRGEAITLHVSTLQPRYTIEIYRMGYYGGTGARLVQTIPDLLGVR